VRLGLWKRNYSTKASYSTGVHFPLSAVLRKQPASGGQLFSIFFHYPRICPSELGKIGAVMKILRRIIALFSKPRPRPRPSTLDFPNQLSAFLPHGVRLGLWKRNYSTKASYFIGGRFSMQQPRQISEQLNLRLEF